jgi:hypothetical protein
MCVSLLLFRDVVVVFLSRNPNVSTPHNSSPERRAPFDKPQRFVSIVTRFAPFVDRSWAEGIRNLEKKKSFPKWTKEILSFVFPHYLSLNIFYRGLVVRHRPFVVNVNYPQLPLI